MALQLVDSGPKMDWTMDSKIFDRYLIWKSDVELIFSSALSQATPSEKSAYLRLWMGREGKPLLNKWISTGRIDFSNPEEIPATQGRARVPLSNGFIIQTFWDLLELELKPKGNKLISILELLSDKSKQGSKPLNEWLSYVYNLVETCDYGDSKDRIIRDILFKGCASAKAKDTIIRKGDQILLTEVLEILQAEDATSNTHQTIKEIDSTPRILLPQYTMHRMKTTRSPRKSLILPSRIQILLILQSLVTDVVNLTAKNMSQYAEPRKHSAMGVARKDIFFKFAGPLASSHRSRRPNSTDRKQTHYISEAPAATRVQPPTGFYNEQGDWVSEPPRYPQTNPAVYSLSVVQPTPVIQDIQDIHPEADPELPSTQGMTQSQISFRETKQTFSSPKKQSFSRTGSKLHANSMEKQPKWQNSTKSFSSSVLQVSQQSPRDQDIQHSTNVSVQSFRDTETDPETTSNTDTGDSKKFQVSNFRNDLQRKGEVILQLPIDSTQFQQFCKELNDKELFLCRDLLEKEIYGK